MKEAQLQNNRGSAGSTTQTAPRKKILIIDADEEELRKARSSALRPCGHTVYPALKLEDAQSRCWPGRFDLIVVHPAGIEERAVAFCDGLRQRNPGQPILLLAGAGAPFPRRDYIIADSPEALRQKVTELLGASAADHAIAA
jgi:CheY-like chemotaxis protein